METETQWIYDRMTLHRLHHDYPDWSAARLAQAVGRSERWARKWLHRLDTAPTAHYTIYLSQSRAPKTHPRQTPEPVKDTICDLRVALSEQYHRPAGGILIAQALRQDQTLQASGLFVPTSNRTISRILRERGYIRTPPKHEPVPLELGAPMAEWEMDFCEIRLEDGRFEFFLVVDRGTSRVVYLEGCEGYQAETALLAVTRLFVQCGLPPRLRFDRDPRLVWSWSADSYPAPLVRLLHVLGVEPVICPPRRPDKKPYVERCVRTFKHEWLDRFSLNTMADCYAALAAFPHYHNAERIHLGRACQGKTPDTAFPDLPVLPSLPEMVDPNGWLNAQHGRVFRRHIRANGTIQVDKHVYYIDRKLGKRPVLVHLDAERRCLWVTLDGQPLGEPLPLKGLQADQMDLQAYLKVLQAEARSIAIYRQLMWQQSADTA